MTTSLRSPIARISGRVAGTVAHQISWPCEVATVRRTPAARSAGAISPSGAAAPNQTRSQPLLAGRRATRRVIAGVGTISRDGSRTTWNGRSASSSASPRWRAVCTTTWSGGSSLANREHERLDAAGARREVVGDDEGAAAACARP